MALAEDREPMGQRATLTAPQDQRRSLLPVAPTQSTLAAAEKETSQW